MKKLSFCLTSIDFAPFLQNSVSRSVSRQKTGKNKKKNTTKRDDKFLYKNQPVFAKRCRDPVLAAKANPVAKYPSPLSERKVVDYSFFSFFFCCVKLGNFSIVSILYVCSYILNYWKEFYFLYIWCVVHWLKLWRLTEVWFLKTSRKAKFYEKKKWNSMKEIYKKLNLYMSYRWFEFKNFEKYWLIWPVFTC